MQEVKKSIILLSQNYEHFGRTRWTHPVSIKNIELLKEIDVLLFIFQVKSSRNSLLDDTTITGPTQGI